MKGVRLQLPAFPFEDENYQANGEYSFYDNCVTEEGKKLDFLLAYPKEKLYQVEYISQARDIKLFTKNITGNQIIWDFRPEDIGRYKYSEWVFQKEWRYRIFIMPRELASFNKKPFASEEAASNELEKIFSRTKGLIRYYDMKIHETALNALEILTGPLCDDAEYEIIDTLTSRYARNARTKKSQLKIRK